MIINQLATPGLGSIMGGRRVSGSGQLLLAVAGFVLIVSWMARFFCDQYCLMADLPPAKGSYGWLGQWGLALFGLAWLWSLITSISLLRHAKEDELAVPPPISTPPPLGPGASG